MLKIIAISLNIFLFGLSLLLIIDEIEYIDSVTVVFILIFLLTPIINLFIIVRNKEKSWIKLYFERKSLEEKNKILELSKRYKIK